MKMVMLQKQRRILMKITSILKKKGTLLVRKMKI